MTAPAVKLTERSGWRGSPPRRRATREVDGMVPLFTRSIRVWSYWVVTLNAFCWPGVGARKPVLAPARRAAAGARRTRPDSFPFVAVPKSSKSSSRRALPTVHASPSPRTSRSPYTAALARLHVPAAMGLNPGKPFEPALNPCAA